jgi:trehalose synthase
MLQAVDVGRECLACYELSAGTEAVEQLLELARTLRGCRVLHLNATPYGGGVAEILRSEIPLLRDLGLDAEWKIISGDQNFFSVTKAIHNGLQGARRMLSAEERTIYLEKARKNAELLEGNYDAIFVHDPQPLPLLQFHGKGNAKWLFRCHIDTSEPNPEVWDFVAPFLTGYDAYVFTLASFVPEELKGRRVEVIPPAIDPESPKNMKLDRAFAARILRWLGMGLEVPFITQVSRFDPWKDPLGVIKAFQLMKREMPELHLALIGSMALDDPEGWQIYRQVQDAANDDGSIRIFTNLTGVGNMEVKRLPAALTCGNSEIAARRIRSGRFRSAVERDASRGRKSWRHPLADSEWIWRLSC